MLSRRVAWILMLALWQTGAVSAQTPKLRRPETGGSIRPAALKITSQKPEAARQVLPARSVPDWTASVPSSNQGAQLSVPPRQKTELRFGRFSEETTLRIVAEKTSFLTEARIPIAELWSGRLRLSGVQQRFHSANLYSMLSASYAEQVTVAPGLASVVARPRVNYGVGVQLRFGR